MLRNRGYLKEVTAGKGGKVTPALFDMVLGSKITQYDKRSMRSRYYNPNALGLLLAAAQKAEKEMGQHMDSDDPRALQAYQRVLRKNFTSDFSPMKFVVKAIDTYLKTGKTPKITGKAGSTPYRESRGY